MNQLRREQIGIAMAAGQQRLGATKELDAHGRRTGRSLTSRATHPLHCLEVAAWRAEHQVVGDLQEVGSGVCESSGGIAVENPADGCGHVLIDRIVHELVAEHDGVTVFTEEAGVERIPELRDDLGRRSTGDRGHVMDRDAVAEHRRDLTQLERRLGQEAEPPNDEIAQGIRELGCRQLRRLPVAAQHALVRQRAEHLHDPQRIAAALASAPVRPGRGRAELAARERVDVVGRQRPESYRTGARGERVVEELIQLGRTREGRNVATRRKGTCASPRAIDRSASSVEVSAQWTSSITRIAGCSAHKVSRRSRTSSTTRTGDPRHLRASVSPNPVSPTSRRPISARRGSRDRRLRSNAAATARTGGCARTGAPRPGTRRLFVHRPRR